MSDLSLSIEKIAGSTSKNNACAVYSKRITLYDGSLGAVVSNFLLRDGEEENLTTVIADLFEISSRKFEETKEGPFEAISIAAAACSEYAQGRGIELNFALIFFYKEACYLAKSGEKIKVYVTDLQKSTEITFNLGSGIVKEGQVYLIATEKFLSIFDRANLVSEANLEEIIDGLATEISARDDQSEVGAAFVLVKAKEESLASIAKDEQEVAQGKEKIAKSEEFEGFSNQGKIEVETEEEELYREVSKKRLPPKNFLGLVLGFMRRIFAEVKSLRRGDIGAIFRLRRNIVIFAAVILVILVSSGVIGVRQKQNRQKLVQFDAHMAQASAKYSEGIAIIELNMTRAREKLIEAGEEVKLALALFGDDDQANKLREEILGKLKETESVAKVNFQVFYEAPEVINSLSTRGKNIVAIGDKKIFEIMASDKSASEFGGKDGIRFGAVYQDSVFFLAGGKVWRLDLGTKKTDEIAQKEGASDLAVFLGNIYLLLDNQIAKFVPIENGYAPASDYLSEQTQFRVQSRLVIDGSIWVTGGNQILKFLRGEGQTFEISGLTSEVSEFGLIYTSPNFDNLYVVDKGNSALLVIDKEGVYQRAHQADEFGKATDLLVSQDESKMYIAVGAKILEADLK